MYRFGYLRIVYSATSVHMFVHTQLFVHLCSTRRNSKVLLKVLNYSKHRVANSQIWGSVFRLMCSTVWDVVTAKMFVPEERARRRSKWYLLSHSWKTKRIGIGCLRMLPAKLTLLIHS